MRKNQKGFTLIELAIVIVILGILAAVAFPRYQELRGEAHVAASEAIIGSIRTGVMTYFARHRVFPPADNATFFNHTLHEPPVGWSVTTANATLLRIHSNPNPVNGTITTWTYTNMTGRITSP
ncbi:MAG: Fimbrial protein [candidate division WS2 bacterium]|uniref:Fimbrial protein n=1 Tax=Psychracetigena formicireducens TaxID=2986056 RepID=A0A9E2BIM7_PSYF1|nr:Fimbrial protein [Candidatus Psychracetigena formicireducens]